MFVSKNCFLDCNQLYIENQNKTIKINNLQLRSMYAKYTCQSLFRIIPAYR